MAMTATLRRARALRDFGVSRASGATGLVEWPVVLTVGGTAVVLRDIDRRQREGRSNGADGSQSLELVDERGSGGAAPRKPDGRKASSARSRSTQRSSS